MRGLFELIAARRSRGNRTQRKRPHQVRYLDSFNHAGGALLQSGLLRLDYPRSFWPSSNSQRNESLQLVDTVEHGS